MASLADVIEPVLLRRQMELEELSQVKAGSRLVVRITVDGDGAGQGLTLDDVAEASREISQVLDETNVMGERAYVLEVGTRGVDKPLTKPAHYRRNIGRLVQIKIADSVVTDRITAADEESVTLAGGRCVPFSLITKAVIQIEMNRDDEMEDLED